MNNQRIILTIASIIILFGLIAYGSMQMKKPATVSEPYPTIPDTRVPQEMPSVDTMPPAENNEEMVVCTMEAKMCPDGSYVGRTGPRCEFATCPGN